jgi:hypothetical protein
MTARKPLSFIQPAPDPMRGMPEQETNEKSIMAEVEAVKIGMVERLKQDAKRKKLAVSTEDYFVVAFESGEQALAFLNAVGYPFPQDRFIDGTILAEGLKVKLPRVTEKIGVLKTIHDRSLTDLITIRKGV